jgi:penicillin amidase
LVLRALFGQRLPITSGDLKVTGPSKPVLIRRDRFGIPYIKAETDVDAWYGLGFCQGQDRAFQLEMLLRVTRGTISELVGEAALPIDQLSRRVGFHRAAQGHVEALEPEFHQVVSAFAAGVTAGATSGCRKVAHEFALLRASPAPFEAVDVLASLNYAAFGLSSWTAKISRLMLLQQDGPEALQALDNVYADWHPVTQTVDLPAGPSLDRLAEDLARLVQPLGLGAASNNWALASSRTATGRPLLANDPHLAPSIPPPWYLAHLRTPDWSVTGASFVGVPFIPAGHNETAAWGVTAGLADNIDLYLEEPGPDGRSVRDGDQFVPCEIRREKIDVKDGDSIDEDILVAPRGPIISPILAGPDTLISMRATWMEPTSIRGLLRAHRVTNFAEFQHAVADSPASLNLVYADTADAVGWQLVGTVPRRNKAWGTLPLPGWSQDAQWAADPIPFDEMPHCLNPDAGFVASANNKPIADDNGPYLGIDWVDGYRYARIVEVLKGRRNWDLPAMLALQLDELSIPWREMREIVLTTPVETQEAQEALDLLRSWDGVVAAESPAATVYELFVADMLSRMARAKTPNAFVWATRKGFHMLFPYSMFGIRQLSLLVTLLRQQPAGWFQPSWQTEIGDALAQAVRSLRAKCGPSPDQWGWGSVRPVVLVHPLGIRQPLAKIFNIGPFPWGGDGQTIAQTGRVLTDPMANSTLVANLRMVIDVGNWEENSFVLAGGQSGNPLSPHYADQLELWKRGEGIAIAWSEVAIDRVRQVTLRLNPL